MYLGCDTPKVLRACGGTTKGVTKLQHSYCAPKKQIMKFLHQLIELCHLHVKLKAEQV
jgi:hypothetical protein